MTHTTTTKVTPAQLRKAALRIAQRRHPDQAGTVPSNAFARKSWGFCAVEMTGGQVLITRDEAETEALR